MAYEVPNHTQTPNELFDEHMRKMTGSELKVVLAACRKTFGWHKEKDRISITQFMEMTGLSRNAVKAGIKSAMKRRVLARRKIETNGKVHGGFEYGLILTGGGSKKNPSPRVKNSTTSRGKGGSKNDPTKEKRNKYPYNRLKKNYLGEEFVEFIED